MVKIYQKAPEFTTQGYFEGKIQNFSLKDFHGKWTVLFFYPLDFTFVCPTELQQFSERHDAFKRLNAQVLSCSIDSPYSHQAWSKAELKHRLWERARVRLDRFSAENLARFSIIAPERFVGRPPDADVPWCVRPDDLVVIVAGGPGKHSSVIPTFGATRTVTVAIEA